MRYIVFTIYFLFFGTIWANDAYITTAGGNVLPIEGMRNGHIQMSSENIDIILNDDSYQIKVDFDFFNNGPSETVTVGFPQWRGPQPTTTDFLEFSAKVNGLISPYQTVKPVRPDLLSEHILVTKWYTRKIDFPAESITQTSIQYTAPYGVYGISQSADYLFGTGATWNAPIGKITLRIKNNSSKWINELRVDGLSDLLIEEIEGTAQIVLENVSPELGAMITLIVDKVPTPLVTMRRINPEKEWFFRDRVVSSVTLKLLTKEQLRILRNLIFAARGQIFESSDLNNWLHKYCSSWYRPSRKISIDDLSPNELQNLRLIQNEESRRF